jgi:hypothetical protein
MAQQQHGIQRLIEMGITLLGAAHATPAIQHENHLLIALILVFFGDKPTVPGSGLPVDLPQAVTGTVFPQLMKVTPLTTALASVDSHPTQSMVGRQQCITGDFTKIRKYADPIGLLKESFLLPEPQRRRPDQINSTEKTVTATIWAHPVTGLQGSSGRQLQIKG